MNNILEDILQQEGIIIVNLVINIDDLSKSNFTVKYSITKSTETTEQRITLVNMYNLSVFVTSMKNKGDTMNNKLIGIILELYIASIHARLMVYSPL